ncbi:MAG TPA: hypothetical protein VGN13_11950 [Solirubrobacteraceae bacterium]
MSHWMSTLAGGDFYELSRGHTVPTGLVSDPPDYRACVAHLGASVAGPPTGRPPSAAELLRKCSQLYAALREQAVSYLVNASWTIGLYGEVGIQATPGEVNRLFEQIRAREFPAATQLTHYLAARRWTLADELFVVRQDLLSQKVQARLSAGGQQAYASLTEHAQRWTAKTTCRAGYVVRHCAQFTESRTAGAAPSPAVLMEQIAALMGVSCTNEPACGRG